MSRAWILYVSVTFVLNKLRVAFKRMAVCDEGSWPRIFSPPVKWLVSGSRNGCRVKTSCVGVASGAKELQC